MSQLRGIVFTLSILCMGCSSDGTSVGVVSGTSESGSEGASTSPSSGGPLPGSSAGAMTGNTTMTVSTTMSLDETGPSTSGSPGSTSGSPGSTSDDSTTGDPGVNTTGIPDGFGDSCVAAAQVVAVQPGTPYVSTAATGDFADTFETSGTACAADLGVTGQGASDVVYSLFALVGGQYVFRLEAEFDAVLYTDADCGGTPHTCSAAALAGPGEPAVLNVDVPEGGHAYAVVDGRNAGVQGDFELTVSVAGDSCDDPALAEPSVAELPYFANVNLGAWGDDHPTMSSCAAAPEDTGFNDVVHRFVAPQTDTYTFFMIVANQQASLAVHHAVCDGGASSCVAAMSDEGLDEIYMEVGLTGGETYFVIAESGSDDGEPGLIHFSIDFAL